MTRVLCAGDQFIRSESLARAAVAALGPEIETVRYETTWPEAPFGDVEGVREASGDPDEMAALMADVDVVLTHLAPVSRTVVTAAAHLRAIGVTRGGPVNADLDAATEAGVPVIFLPGRNLGAVAEFTVGVMVALPRGIASASRSLSAGTWDAQYFRFDRTGPELGASTVGLVGLGAVGLRVAELVRSFGARVLGHDPYADPEVLAQRGITAVSLPELLAGSDMVSVHARLTEQTHRLFDEAAFAAMREGSYFINTARGELVDQDALLAALESGRLAGAALDVFDPEPPAPGDRLLARPDVLATPHLAGASRQVALVSVQRVADEVGEFLRTGALQNCANPDWNARAAAG